MATLEQYQKMLFTNKLRLDDELELQAEVQYNIGAEVVRLNTKMLEAKDYLQRIEAQLLDDFKSDKVTVDQAKGRVMRDPNRQKAWAGYQQLREVHELWDALLDAWITKGYKIADLAALYGSDYFAVRTVSGDHAAHVVSPAQEQRRAEVQAASTRVGRGVDSFNATAPRRRAAL